MNRVSVKLLIATAIGGYKKKGAELDASNAEKKIIEFMEHNNCYLVLEDGKLIWKGNE